MDTIEQRAERLVRNEVHVCLSSLVATLAQSMAFTQEGHAGGESSPQSLQELSEQAFELQMPVQDYEEAATQADWTPSTAPLEYVNKDKTVDYERLCNELGIEPYEWEIFEHWAVSESLAKDLESLGERVDMDFAGLCVWGRTTSGQAISMDGIIHRVLALHDERYAQAVAS